MFSGSLSWSIYIWAKYPWNKFDEKAQCVHILSALSLVRKKSKRLLVNGPRVVHKLRRQDFGFFWPPIPLPWHFLPYECWQKVDIFGLVNIVCEWPQKAIELFAKISSFSEESICQCVKLRSKKKSNICRQEVQNCPTRKD